MHPKGVLFDYAAWQENPLSEEAINKDEGHIGYYEHLNLMLGCYALLNNEGRFQDIHRELSDAIARRMLEYPPDNTVSVASLRIADKVFERAI